MSFGLRLKLLLRQKKIRQKELADAIGCSAQTVSFWITDRNEPRAAQLKKLSEFLGVPEPELAPESEGALTLFEKKPEPRALKPVSFRFYTVPLYGAEEEGEVPVPESLVRAAPGAELAAVPVTGDQMEPAAEPGDLWIADLSDCEPVTGGVFLFNENGRPAAYRVQCLPGGGLRLISDNGRYPALTMSRAEAASLLTLGRVLAAVTHKKL